MQIDRLWGNIRQHVLAEMVVMISSRVALPSRHSMVLCPHASTLATFLPAWQGLWVQAAPGWPPVGSNGIQGWIPLAGDDSGPKMFFLLLSSQTVLAAKRRLNMASHSWHWTSSGTLAVSNARPVASSSLGNTLASECLSLPTPPIRAPRASASHKSCPTILS